MNPHVNSLERAFELARTGSFNTIREIQDQLHQEGYSSKMVVGKQLSTQLRDLIRHAQATPVA
jgi:hypothetical protein